MQHNDTSYLFSLVLQDVLLSDIWDHKMVPDLCILGSNGRKDIYYLESVEACFQSSEHKLDKSTACITNA